MTSGVAKSGIEMLQFSGQNPFSRLSPANEGAVWVKPDHVCVVEYMPNLQNALRQPVFKGFRDDVPPEEVRAE